jgi:putative transcriptional regulator
MIARHLQICRPYTAEAPLKAGPPAAGPTYAIDAGTPLAYNRATFVGWLRQHLRRAQMKKQGTFEEVLAYVKQATDLARAGRVAAPRLQINALTIRELRGRTKLSQPQFAALLGVELSTLRNWEQGRREPTGPARALLRAIRNDPENVIRALASAA